MIANTLQTLRLRVTDWLRLYGFAKKKTNKTIQRTGNCRAFGVGKSYLLLKFVRIAAKISSAADLTVRGKNEM